MKFTAAVVLAAAAGASAHAHGNVTVVTEVVESYVTYCPGPTEITHGGTTYTVTEATTLTITDCPCTITKPVITTSAVECHDCAVPTTTPVVVVPPPAGHNSTVYPPPVAPPASSAPPAGPPAPPAPPATTPPASGASKAIAMSGAGLAGVLALAAFL